MANDPDPQSDQTPEPPKKPTRTRIVPAASDVASPHQGDEINTPSGNGVPDGSNPPPAGDGGTPPVGVHRVTVPPPPGTHSLPPQPAPGSPQGAYSAPVNLTPPPSSGPSAGQRIGRAFSRLLGWLVAALFGIGLGLLVFTLAPLAFRQIIAPVSENTEGLARLDAEMSDLSEQIGDIQAEQLDQDRALIDARTNAEQRIADAEGRLADAEGRLRDSEDAIAAQQGLIQDLEETLDQQTAQLEDLNTTLAELQEELPGQAEYDAYNRQLLLMRAWQELLRARLRLLENNPGQALEELAAARATLDQTMAMSDAEQQANLNEVIERVDMVITEITENPFAATGDLEIAWQMLGGMITPPGLLPVTTPSPTETPEATATP